jgi:hypothetical protein
VPVGLCGTSKSGNFQPTIQLSVKCLSAPVLLLLKSLNNPALFEDNCPYNGLFRDSRSDALSAMEYPHWLMVAGAILVVLGLIGFALRKRVVEPTENRHPVSAAIEGNSQPNQAGQEVAGADAPCEHEPHMSRDGKQNRTRDVRPWEAEAERRRNGKKPPR